MYNDLFYLSFDFLNDLKHKMICQNAKNALMFGVKILF